MTDETDPEDAGGRRERPTEPLPDGGDSPTGPVGRGGESPTDPIPPGGESPTEDLPEGDRSPTRPLPEGNENPTEPLTSGGTGPAGSGGTAGTAPTAVAPEGPARSDGAGDRGLWILLGSIVAAVLLVGIYLAAGGLDFKPAAAADPCDAREWGDPQGLEQTAERFSLSAIDGAACELGVSREELTRALASEQSRIAFAEDNGLSDAEVEDAIRSGLERAIDDGESAGAIGSLAASGLRLAVKVMPVGEMAYLALDATEVFQDGGFDGIGGLIDGAFGALEDLGSDGSGSSGDPGGGSGGSNGSPDLPGGGGSDLGNSLDELEKQLRENVPDQVPPELEDQIQKGLDGLFGP